MQSLIAIDLDGTLLNAYGEISKEDKEEIQKQIAKGEEVILASGRTITAMENFAEDVGANNYLISGNGTVVYDLKNKKTIYEKYLSKEKVLEIVKKCEENSMYYNVYTDKSIITKSLKFNTLFYYSENIKKPPEKRTNIEIITNIPEYLKKLEEPFLKITVCDTDKNIFQRMSNSLKQIKGIDILDVEHMSRKIVRIDDEEKHLEYYYTEITSSNVNKWNAITFLAEKMQIAPENIITIGDNINDIKMIQNAAYGIAMGNSSPRVKEIANFITDDNNNSGVAKALQILSE